MYRTPSGANESVVSWGRDGNEEERLRLTIVISDGEPAADDQPPIAAHVVAAATAVVVAPGDARVLLVDADRCAAVRISNAFI